MRNRIRKAVLFDLGNTLASYYERAEFPALLDEAIGEVKSCLASRAALTVSDDAVAQRAARENHEAEDFRVRPLEGRLARVFDLEEGPTSSALMTDLCRCFMRPIFARGRAYEDSVPTLRELRATGVRTAIVSNTPWGSPADLWRDELDRLGLTGHLSAAVFCRDVGWRKPDGRIFEHALRLLGIQAAEAVFVGDDPRWDLAGPAAMGMEAVLIDRAGTAPDRRAMRDLRDLRALLGL